MSSKRISDRSMQKDVEVSKLEREMIFDGWHGVVIIESKESNMKDGSPQNCGKKLKIFSLSQ